MNSSRPSRPRRRTDTAGHEDGLAKIGDVDYPSCKVLDAVSLTRVCHKICLEEIYDIWRACCRSISAALAHKRGTRIDRLGVFTLDNKDEPTFVPDPVLVQRFRLTLHNRRLPGSARIVNQGLR